MADADLLVEGERDAVRVDVVESDTEADGVPRTHGGSVAGTYSFSKQAMPKATGMYLQCVWGV